MDRLYKVFKWGRRLKRSIPLEDLQHFPEKI